MTMEQRQERSDDNNNNCRHAHNVNEKVEDASVKEHGCEESPGLVIVQDGLRPHGPHGFEGGDGRAKLQVGSKRHQSNEQ